MGTNDRTSRSTRLLFAAVAVAIALFAAACSSAEASETSTINEIAEVDGLTVANDLSDDQVQIAAVTPTANDLDRIYQSYLDATSQVVTGQSSADILASYATPAAVQQVVAEYEANEVLRRDGKLSTIEALQMWPNVASVSEGEGTITLIDCTERHELNAVDQFNVYFVQQQVTVDTTVEPWVVADVQVMHNGFFEDSRQFGCIPPDLGKRAETAAIDAWSEFTKISRDPSSLGDGLSERFVAPLGPQLEEYLRVSGTEGWQLTTSEEVEFHILGVDTELSLIADNAVEGKVVVVASCHTFPEGRSRTNTNTGETVDQLPPGSVETQWIYVSLDVKPTSDPTYLDTVPRIEHKGEGCNPLG